MAIWFEVEVHGLGGFVAKGDITDEIAAELLKAEERFQFPSGELDERERVARMISTQLAMAIEKGKGLFVLDGPEGSGQKWLIPNDHISAFSITDVGAQRRLGFGPVEPGAIRTD